ncbi:hypothetical protein HII36_41670, partial [Nonomuraea sp. NN258]|uniref:DUF6297 family protein n=1 Tax=Nonomuraea antri TaxID=2730852 RepID=UPI0015684EAF
ALAGCLMAARAVGPVMVSGPDASWLVLSPLNRRDLLTRTGRRLLLIAAIVGLGVGLGLVAALGAPDQLVWRLLGAFVLGVSATAGGVALAVLAQASQSWHIWLTAALVALLVLAVVAVSGQARGALVAVAHAPLSAVGAVAAGAAAIAVLLVRRAWTALGEIPTRAVLAASTRAGHLSNAATGLDPSVLTWIAEDNHWRTRTLTSRPWPGSAAQRRSTSRPGSAPHPRSAPRPRPAAGLGPTSRLESATPPETATRPESATGQRSASRSRAAFRLRAVSRLWAAFRLRAVSRLWAVSRLPAALRGGSASWLGAASCPAPLALAWHDWRRVGRRPGRLAVMFALAALPAVLALAGGGPTVLGASVLVGALAVAVSGTSGARRDADNPALARLLGVGPRAALAARAILPGLLGGLWAAAALTGLTLAGGLPASLTPAAGLSAGLNPAGALPTGLTPVGGLSASLNPAGALPTGLTPAGRLSAGLTPADGLPADVAPVSGLPVDLTPAGGLPVDLTPAGGLPASLAAPGGLPAGLASAGGLPVDLVVGPGLGGSVGVWWAFGVLAAPALAAGALRMARRSPLDHSLPVIDTPGGAIPTGPLLWALTGVDVALLGCLPTAMAVLGVASELGPLLAAQAVMGAATLFAYVLRARTDSSR